MEWCEAEFDASEDRSKDLTRQIGNTETQLGELDEAIKQTADEIAALKAGIAALDTAVAEATEQRKAEHKDWTETSAMNNGALQLLGVAKNRLNKFYNPKLHVAPQRRELTEEEQIYVNSGGADPRDAEEAAAPKGIGGTGVVVFVQLKDDAAPPPPPETAGAYQKKDSGGPLALIDTLKNDLEKEMQAAEADEKDSQKEYEELMADSAAKRAQDSKTITEKDSQKAGLEGDRQDAKKAHKNDVADLNALNEYISTLHGSCDFLQQNFDLRRTARSSEIDAMKKAKAVLNGADYSFTQMGSFLQRRN